MKFKLTISNSFKRDYKKLPQKTKKKVKRILRFIVKDLKHPSIRAKKIKGKKDIWEGRINKFYRFSFKIKNNTIIPHKVGPHDKILKSA